VNDTGQETDRLEREIEAALDPGRFVSDPGCFAFVGGLERVETKVARLVATDPAQAVRLYETFLAGCYEKVEEVDDSSGSFGMFVTALMCGWVTANQATGARTDQTATRLLAWMDDDPYGFCYRLERDVAAVLDEPGLAAFISQVRARFEAAEQAAASGGPGRATQHTHRRWAEALRTLYAARTDVDAYIRLAEQTGLTADDCLTAATMLGTLGHPDQALSWVERGLALDAASPHGSFARYGLAELKPRLLADLGRSGEALETAWTDYRKHPNRYAYDHLMTFVPEPERLAWREKAIATAMDGDYLYLPPLVDLLLHTDETGRLAHLIGRSPDESLEALSHHVAEPAGTKLEQDHAEAAARIWRAQGMRILKAGKSRYYDDALRYLGRAKRCYEQAGQASEWQQIVAEVYAEHRRKTSFLPRFEALANGSEAAPQPSFLEAAKARWAMPDQEKS
jgi:tetratricopeptide (TPR) repeat protein